MAFRFRLDSVLRHRERLEDAAALEVASAEQRREAARIRLDERRAEEAACRRELGLTAERGATGMEIGQLARAVEYLRAAAHEDAAALSAEQARVEQARSALVDASRARRMLERLQETARAAHARRIDAIDRRQTDDIGTVGHLWRRSQPGFETGGPQ
jgi:flagellar export protein FliJ